MYTCIEVISGNDPVIFNISRSGYMALIYIGNQIEGTFLHMHK